MVENWGFSPWGPLPGLLSWYPIFKSSHWTHLKIVNQRWSMDPWSTNELQRLDYRTARIAKFMGPTWGPPGSCRPQMGPMLAPWTLLSGRVCGQKQSSWGQHKAHLGPVAPDGPHVGPMNLAIRESMWTKILVMATRWQAPFYRPANMSNFHMSDILCRESTWAANSHTEAYGLDHNRYMMLLQTL